LKKRLLVRGSNRKSCDEVSRRKSFVSTEAKHQLLKYHTYYYCIKILIEKTDKKEGRKEGRWEG